MIYLDNAATTYPKPEEVYQALDNANRHLAFNAGRGEYKESTEAFNLIEDTRAKVAGLVNRCKDEVVFTSSATESLNLIINGINVCDGDFVYVSPFEHNAVIRPLRNLQKTIDFKIKVLPFNKENWLPCIEDIEDEFAMYHPKAVFISHLSNVSGYLIPYETIFEKASEWDSVNVLDCSQSFGVINPTDLSNTNYIIFAGHKSLYASFGIAGFLKLKDDKLAIKKAGGTGSDSLNPEMPSEIPYRYEAGSPNIVAIAGLNASIEWLKRTNVKEKEEELMEYLLSKLSELENIIIYKNKTNPSTVLSINVEGYSSEEAASILNEEYGICVRAGYHCAPWAHDFINSKAYNGTVRISFNYFNNIEDVDELIEALNNL